MWFVVCGSSLLVVCGLLFVDDAWLFIECWFLFGFRHCLLLIVCCFGGLFVVCVLMIVVRCLSIVGCNVLFVVRCWMFVFPCLFDIVSFSMRC